MSKNEIMYNSLLFVKTLWSDLLAYRKIWWTQYTSWKCHYHSLYNRQSSNAIDKLGWTLFSCTPWTGVRKSVSIMFILSLKFSRKFRNSYIAPLTINCELCETKRHPKLYQCVVEYSHVWRIEVTRDTSFGVYKLCVTHSKISGVW